MEDSNFYEVEYDKVNWVFWLRKYGSKYQYYWRVKNLREANKWTIVWHSCQMKQFEKNFIVKEYVVKNKY